MEAVGGRKSDGDYFHGRVLSMSEWETKQLGGLANLSKPEKEKKYASYKERKAQEQQTKRGPQLTSHNTYGELMANNQGLIGPPHTLFGPVPRVAIKASLP